LRLGRSIVRAVEDPARLQSSAGFPPDPVTYRVRQCR
jgi:hypothetical protein